MSALYTYDETERHVNNMVELYEHVRELFEDEVAELYNVHRDLAGDIVRMNLVLHDVGKFTHEYTRVRGFDHSSEYVANKFFDEFKIQPLINIDKKLFKNILGTVHMVIIYHHEIRRKDDEKRMKIEPHFVKEKVIDLFNRHVRYFKLVEGSVACRISYIDPSSVGVLNIVTLLDNIEAILMRRGSDASLSQLMHEYLQNTVYSYVFNVAKELWGCSA